MTRLLTVAAAQLGPIQKSEGRDVAVARMVRLMERAHQRGVQLVVFPELALTTFFPRHYHENKLEADHWFEEAMPSNETAPLFEAARRYGIGFHLGYAEIAHEPDETGAMRRRYFNTAILVSPAGEVLLKYRKVHLPGHADFKPERNVQHLEKLYFEVGNLGFPVIRAPMGPLDGLNMGMMICNDRRWPEAWRVLGLQSVELVMLGYNTPSLNQEKSGFEAHHLRVFSQPSVDPGRLLSECDICCGQRPRRGWRTVTSCSVTRSSSTRRVKSWRWPQVGMTNSSPPTATSICAGWGRTTIFNFAEHRRPEAYTRIGRADRRRGAPGLGEVVTGKRSFLEKRMKKPLSAKQSGSS